MKIVLLTIMFVSAFVRAEPICKDYKIKESTAMNWIESDFNEKSANSNMAALQDALNNQGSIGSCGLHNALAMVEGYILKQQVMTALASETASSSIKQYNVIVFCDFLNHAKPCE